MILLPNSPFSSVSNYQAMISTSLKKKYINFIHNAVADTEEQLHKQIFFLLAENMNWLSRQNMFKCLNNRTVYFPLNWPQI